MHVVKNLQVLPEVDCTDMVCKILYTLWAVYSWFEESSEAFNCVSK